MIEQIHNHRNSEITYRGIWFDDIGFELFSEKFQKSKQENPCTVCGKKTNNSLGVLVGRGGATIVHPEDIEKAEDGGYMGWFAVGNECIKKVPKEFWVTGQTN
jgi:hypothetical protein